MATKIEATKNVEQQITKENKTAKFDTTFMIIAIIAITFFLVIAVTTYFRSTFVMYTPEKVATQYMKNVAAQDGYDAMKYTITIKNSKLGDFIVENYMNKYANQDKKVKAPELSAEEQGKNLTLILNTMYPVFTDLVEQYGFSQYDKLFTEYFAKYYEVHHIVYGHDIITTDDMFDAFEGNVSTYTNEYAYDCEKGFGKGSEYAEKYLGRGKASLADDDLYSAGYLITIKTDSKTEYTQQQVEEYRNDIKNNADRLSYYDRYNLSVDDISEVCTINAVEGISGEGDRNIIDTKNAEFKEHPTKLTLVKIGSQWYVDITA